MSSDDTFKEKGGRLLQSSAVPRPVVPRFGCILESAGIFKNSRFLVFTSRHSDLIHTVSNVGIGVFIALPMAAKSGDHWDRVGLPPGLPTTVSSKSPKMSRDPLAPPHSVWPTAKSFLNLLPHKLHPDEL